jgi:hypothetical protein
MGYYSIMKNEVMSFEEIWIELEIMMLGEISQTHQDKHSMFSFIL